MKSWQFILLVILLLLGACSDDSDKKDEEKNKALEEKIRKDVENESRKQAVCGDGNLQIGEQCDFAAGNAICQEKYGAESVCKSTCVCSGA